MSTVDRIVELVSTQMATGKSAEDLSHAKRRTRGIVQRTIRGAKILALMALTAVLIPITMISLGLLFGPKGYEGFILAPLSVLTSWALILFLALRRRPSATRVAKARSHELAGETASWLFRRRAALPQPTHRLVDRIIDRLESLELPLRNPRVDQSAVTRLHKLLVDDLTGLVEGYERLPADLQSAPLHGAASPKERLVEGLKSIEAELGRVQQRMSADDLHSLATHERYLELKYDPKEDDQ